MNCQLFRRHVGAFVDGELDAATAVEFETHLDACEACLDHLEFEGTTRELVREAMPEVAAPAHLADRVRAALDEEDERESVAPSEPFIPIRWRIAVPLSAAAAIGIFILAAFEAQGKQDEALALDVVRVHSAGLPADVSLVNAETETAPAPDEEVARYFRGKVGFPVRPAEFAARNARLVGARLSNVRERQAAALYYDVEGHRVTVVVTDAPVESAGEEVEVGGRQLIYRDVHGYAVPVREHAGIRYAFTGDLDREQLLQLAASARVP
ncbi:MAG: zf-HC2 domain-containing protein [Deltaproteobacteria bacterium]|nr:zf-HC2 domain-containing protein [Deltaproteobacteria bacterium]